MNTLTEIMELLSNNEFTEEELRRILDKARELSSYDIL